MNRSILCFIGVLMLSIACGGPLVMVPGGALAGDVAPAPSDWGFSDEFETIQLETQPSDPYSVNLWGVGVGAKFYIVSGRGLESAWAQHIGADPNVRLRIGEKVYELRAVRTDETQDREAFLTAVKAKYEDFEPNEEEAAAAVLYRLEAR